MRKQAEAPKRNRTEQIKFWTTPEEKELILKKMELYGTGNMGAYLRKMAIDGYVIKLELPELKEMIRLLGIANNNINQIARSLNSTGRIYEADIQEIRDRIDGLYDYARKILDSLAKITEAPERCAAAEFSAYRGIGGTAPTSVFAAWVPGCIACPQ